MNNIITLKPKAGVELLAIVVNKDAYDFKINKIFQLVYRKENEGCFYFIGFDKNNYSVLGTVEYKDLSKKYDVNPEFKELFEPTIEIEFDCESLFDKPKNGNIEFNTNNWNVIFTTFLEANKINLQQLDKENKKLVILKRN